MQKHEREALRVAQHEAAKHGLTVTICEPAGAVPKRRLLLRNGSAERHYTIASSPRDRDACISQVRQWVRRTAKEIKHG